MQDRVLIIIPAYNEEKNLSAVVTSLRTLVPEYDVLVINDGSSDNTETVLKELEVDYISHPFNLNYGGAVQTGFKYAVRNSYDYVIQFDGDGQHLADEIPKLLAAMEETSSDIVIGSRYLNKEDFKQSFARLMGTKIFKLLVKVITGKAITDPTSGFQILNRRVFTFYSKRNHYPQEYPDANVLIMMILAGYKITEVGVKMKLRVHGNSMHSGLSTIKYIIKMFYSIVLAILKGRDHKKERVAL